MQKTWIFFISASGVAPRINCTKPSEQLVANTAYGVRHKSSLSSLRSESISRIIWSTNWSCLRSSPRLKIVVYASAHSNGVKLPRTVEKVKRIGIKLLEKSTVDSGWTALTWIDGSKGRLKPWKLKRNKLFIKEKSTFKSISSLFSINFLFRTSSFFARLPLCSETILEISTSVSTNF